MNLGGYLHVSVLKTREEGLAVLCFLVQAYVQVHLGDTEDLG